METMLTLYFRSFIREGETVGGRDSGREDVRMGLRERASDRKRETTCVMWWVVM